MAESALEHRLLTIPVATGTALSNLDIHSGLYRHYPRIYGNLVSQPGVKSDTGVIMVHPMSNFHGHLMLEPVARTGLPIIGLNTRYAGNDAAVIMENCLIDVGAAVDWVKKNLGWKKVILFGFSGGGPLVSYYQSQAEHPTERSTPAGDPPNIVEAKLPLADGLLLMASSVSRMDCMLHMIDPSVTDESDPDSRDPDLDIYAEGRKIPLDRDWLARYEAAQRARMERIDDWVMSELKRLRKRGIRDRAFVVHRNVADPRMIDLTVDPTDRELGSIWGDPRLANEATGPMGRYTSLTAWLSTWSLKYSRANGPEHLAKVSVPVCIICLTADQAVFKSMFTALRDAVPPKLRTYIEIKGANHYFLGQKDGPDNAARQIHDWAEKAGLV